MDEIQESLMLSERNQSQKVTDLYDSIYMSTDTGLVSRTEIQWGKDKSTNAETTSVHMQKNEVEPLISYHLCKFTQNVP